MEFGDQMRQLRKREGLTQEQLAQRLMVTRQAVSNWERGTNLPDIETLIRIATTFHVSLDLLILGKGESNMDDKDLAGPARRQAPRRRPTARWPASSSATAAREGAPTATWSP